MRTTGAGPLGQPLDSVLSAEHLELENLLVEVARDPTTPGVVRELVENLDHRTRVHLAVCEHLLFPVLDGCGRPDLVAQAWEAHDDLRDRLIHLTDGGDAPPPDFDGFRRVLEDHMAFEDEVLVPAIAAAGRDSHGIGSRFSTMADAGFITAGPHD